MFACLFPLCVKHYQDEPAPINNVPTPKPRVYNALPESPVQFSKHIGELPDEIIVEIFSYVSAGGIMDQVRLVCKKWCILCRDRQVWKDRTLTDKTHHGLGMYAKGIRRIQINARVKYQRRRSRSVMEKLLRKRSAPREEITFENVCLNCLCSFSELEVISVRCRLSPFCYRVLNAATKNCKQVRKIKLTSDVHDSSLTACLVSVRQTRNVQSFEFVVIAQRYDASMRDLISIRRCYPELTEVKFPNGFVSPLLFKEIVTAELPITKLHFNMSCYLSVTNGAFIYAQSGVPCVELSSVYELIGKTHTLQCFVPGMRHWGPQYFRDLADRLSEYTSDTEVELIIKFIFLFPDEPSLHILTDALPRVKMDMDKLYFTQTLLRFTNNVINLT